MIRLSIIVLIFFAGGSSTFAESTCEEGKVYSHLDNNCYQPSQMKYRFMMRADSHSKKNCHYPISEDLNKCSETILNQYVERVSLNIADYEKVIKDLEKDYNSTCKRHKKRGTKCRELDKSIKETKGLKGYLSSQQKDLKLKKAKYVDLLKKCYLRSQDCPANNELLLESHLMVFKNAILTSGDLEPHSLFASGVFNDEFNLGREWIDVAFGPDPGYSEQELYEESPLEGLMEEPFSYDDATAVVEDSASFCQPSADLGQCVTPSGDVYLLDRSQNNLGRYFVSPDGIDESILGTDGEGIIDTLSR